MGFFSADTLQSFDWSTVLQLSLVVLLFCDLT